MNLATNLWTTKTIDLTTASPAEGVPYYLPGHTFQVVAASSAAARVAVDVDARDDSRRFELAPGMGWEHRPFKVLWLTWAAQPGVSVTLAWAGRPDDFDPRLTKVIPASQTNSVTVDNPLGDPVNVNLVTPAPLPVVPSAGYFPTWSKPLERSMGAPADWYQVAAWNQVIALDAFFTLTGAGQPGGMTNYTAVPAGKVLEVQDAFCDSSGTYGAGFLYVHNGTTGVACSPVSSESSKALNLIGLIVPAGHFFMFVSKFSGSQTVNVAVSGRLRNV